MINLKNVNYKGKMTKQRKILEFLKLIIILGYYEDNEKGFSLNERIIAGYLGVSGKSVYRFLKTTKEHNFLTMVGKKIQFSKISKLNDTRNYYYNLYIADIKKINDYLVNLGYEDVLSNILSLKKEYDEYFEYIGQDYIKRYNDAVDNLSEEEYLAEIKKNEERMEKEKKKFEELKEENVKYLNMLKEINEVLNIKINYLDEERKRLTNAICCTKNPEKHPEDGNRYRLLREYFKVDDDTFEEFDTNASIYRLSYALGNKKLLSHDIDVYEMIYNDCNFSIPWSKDVRNIFKQLLMPIYMREWSIAFKCLMYDKWSRWTTFYFESTKKEYEFYKQFEDLLHLPLREILDRVCAAMHRAFNLDKFYMAQIFIHESNLHILMLKKFFDLGIKTINVYDGFYFINGTMNQELYDKIYDESTMELLNDYFEIAA